MGLRSNGLWLEVVGREISGRPVPGKPRRPSGPYLLGLPALLLSSLLLVPIAVTVGMAFRTDDGFGLGNFAVMGDPAALRAVGNSLVWVAVALGLVMLGFLIALVSYRLPGLLSILQPALVLPFAVSVCARCLQHLGSAELVAGRIEKARELLELSELLRGGNTGHPILMEYLQAAREAGPAPVLLEEQPRVGVGWFRRQLVRLWRRWTGR